MPGDVVFAPFQADWYVVDSAFQEGEGGPTDLDLHREVNGDGLSWNAGHDEQVQRRIVSS